MLKHLRVRLALGTGRLLDVVGRWPAGRKAIRICRDLPVVSGLLKFALCFRGTFANLADAKACAAGYFSQSHDHPFHNRYHSVLAESLRESDYPVLYHLAPIAAQLRTVFDLGGSIGNIFYPYARALALAPDLIWTIHDLPEKRTPALEFARQRDESRIRFTDRMADASGVDLFIVSGALQYFEELLPDMLTRLDQRPRFVAINRTPFSKDGAIVTTQVGSNYLLGCKLHDVRSLVAGMDAIGYELVASWPVHERRMLVPLYPELNDTYRGLFFRLRRK